MQSGKVRYKSRIPQQGLILILIPLSAGSLILLALSGLCSYSEKLAQKERNQARRLAHYNMAINYWSQAVGNLLGRAFADDHSYDKQSDQFKSLLEDELATLAELPTSKDKAGNLARLERLCMQSLESLEGLPKARGTGPISNLSSLQTMPKIFNGLYSLPAKAKVILEQESKSLKQSRRLEDEQMLLIKRTAYICTVGNIVLALIMVWFFARRITSRMSLLTSNANLLPKLEPLKARLSGDDELAYLSRQMEETSEKLIAAAEHRRSIFGMVAHDMRSPITAGQLCLEVTGELFQGPYINDSDKDLERSRQNLTEILAHVNKLLALEKRKQAQADEAHSTAATEIAKTAELKTGDSASNTNEQIQSEEDKNKKIETAAAASEQARPELPPLSLPEQSFMPTAGKSNGQKPVLPIRFFAEFFTAPKIIHKGLILVLVPLAVQLLILGSVNTQLSLLDSLMAKERRLGDLIMRINLSFLKALKATSGEAIYLVSNETKLRASVQGQFEEILAEAKDPELNSQVDKEWIGLLKSWRKILRQHISQFAESQPEHTEITDSITEKIKALKPTQKATVKLRKKISEKFSQETKALEKLEAQEKQSQEFLARTLAWGLFSNFILALSLLFLFNRDISSRLKIVLDHAAQLGSAQPISKLVAGKDELSYLDLILHHSQEQLILASKERSEMMSIIAHDMEKPLQVALDSIADFKKKQENLPEKVQKQVDRAQHNIKRVLLLIDDLITMETLETGKISLELADCDLHSIAEESIATVTSLAKKKNIEVNNECEQITLRADKARLIQTLINYLTNAIKFSPSDTRIRVHSILHNTNVKVIVTDQGPGMDEETRNRVFEKFFQAESPEKKQGFGLGLAICGLIVESHGGVLGVDSEAGKGSSFWFEIPLSGPQVDK